MLITTGGYDSGYSSHQARTAGRASRRRDHRRVAVGLRLEPDREAHRPLDQTAGAVVLLALALLHAQRVVSDLADRHELAPAEHRAAEAVADRAAVADHADLEVVADVFALGAAQHQRGQQPVDGVGDGVALALGAVHAPGFVHRAGLVNQKEEGGRLGPVDLGGVRHNGGARSS
jgi:hypothetical protein